MEQAQEQKALETTSNKTGRKRDEMTLLEDRAAVARLLSEGITSASDIQFRINEGRPQELHVSTVTIRNDIEWLRKQWKESALIDFNSFVNKGLVELNYLRKICFEEFHKSKEPKITTEGSVPDDEIDGWVNGNEDPKVKITKIKEEKREGNPAWIQLAIKIHERECKLLGYEAASKIALTNTKGEDVDIVRDSILSTLASMNKSSLVGSEESE